jgi:hypothetical protein
MIPAIFPLLLLATSIGSMLWYKKTANDIFEVLAVGSALICLIWGLTIAHWSINLFCLLLLLKFRFPLLSAGVKVRQWIN